MLRSMTCLNRIENDVDNDDSSRTGVMRKLFIYNIYSSDAEAFYSNYLFFIVLLEFRDMYGKDRVPVSK
jgi:hypothetical protein